MAMACACIGIGMTNRTNTTLARIFLATHFPSGQIMKTKQEIIDRLAEIARQMRVLEIEECHLVRQLYRMKRIVGAISESSESGLTDEEQTVLNMIIDNGGSISASTLKKKGLLQPALQLCIAGYLTNKRHSRSHRTIFYYRQKELNNVHS